MKRLSIRLAELDRGETMPPALNQSAGSAGGGLLNKNAPVLRNQRMTISAGKW
jgi:hypothetical protein